MSVSLGDAKMASLKDKIREESEKALAVEPALEVKVKKPSRKVGGKKKN